MHSTFDLIVKSVCFNLAKVYLVVLVCRSSIYIKTTFHHVFETEAYHINYASLILCHYTVTYDTYKYMMEDKGLAKLLIEQNYIYFLSYLLLMETL